LSTLSMFAAPPKPQTSTPTTKVDYVVTRDVKGDEPEALVRNFPNRFPETEKKIFELMTWPEGWDGYDAPKPNPVSVTHARLWAEELYRDLSAGLWIEPHVSADEDGEVSFEWWRGRKKLTVYVTPTAVEYIKVDKTNSSLEMKDGSIETPKDRRILWNWLLS
jgi:hypothetical protein